ncbi:GlsB/YeaQ/YmgE family stress response membrane protein [Pantanalinema rosaneae CENA516]|uniref:GlsB/YeaQ/YmgE family stress response membrane protein n=1 Tax=Pantanalinema rosaneae TaxID=1620701 RepID=UPI003D6E0015
MDILAWIVLGLLAGAIAKAIYPGRQGGGIIGTLILGVVGAFVGGSLYNLLVNGTLALSATGLSIGGVFLAVLGAIIALAIYYAVTRRRGVY